MEDGSWKMQAESYIIIKHVHNTQFQHAPTVLALALALSVLLFFLPPVCLKVYVAVDAASIASAICCVLYCLVSEGKVILYE